MKTALVTGATGYIGSVLCKHLQENDWKVIALLRKPQSGPWDKHIVANLGNEPLPADTFHGIDVVFHLAASSDNTDPSGITALDRKVNIEGTVDLLAASIKAGAKKLIYVSTVKAMGEGGEECLDETSPVAPVSSYGRSKLAAEKLVLGQIDVPACVLRLPVVYGMSTQGNIAKMIRAILRHRFPPLPEMNNKRSMVHVKDVARAAELAALASSSTGQVFLVTDGQPYSTRQIYAWTCQMSGRQIPTWHLPPLMLRGIAMVSDTLGKVTGKPMPLDSFALNKLLGSAWYSNEKLRRVLGFRPEHSLQDSLPEIIRGVRESND